MKSSWDRSLWECLADMTSCFKRDSKINLNQTCHFSMCIGRLRPWLTVLFKTNNLHVLMLIFMFRDVNFLFNKSAKPYNDFHFFSLKAALATLKHPVTWLILNWEYKERGENLNYRVILIASRGCCDWNCGVGRFILCLLWLSFELATWKYGPYLFYLPFVH